MNISPPSLSLRPSPASAHAPVGVWAGVLAGAMLAVLSTACVTPAQRAADAERQIEMAMNTFGPACDKLGFQRGTDPWRECVLKLYDTDQNQQAAYLNSGYYGHGGYGAFGGYYGCGGRRFCH